MAGHGAYIILGREDAKQLFAKTDDASVRQFVTGLTKSRTHRQNRLVLDVGPVWETMHRVLTDGTLDRGGGEFPLDHCVLAGRRMHQGNDFDAILVRPDIVPHVAEALHHVKRSDIKDKYYAISAENLGHEPQEKELDSVWTTLQYVRQMYEDAAVERCAVLFVVDHTQPAESAKAAGNS